MEIKSLGTDEWEIYNEGNLVGTIGTFHGFRKSTKYLYVNDKKICEIRNQKEAIEKLKMFFAENKEIIRQKEVAINQLRVGMTQVTHQICLDALIEKSEKLIEELNVLKSYDLI